MSQIQQDERNEYLRERELLVEAESQAAERLDKAVLTLSGGALGLSITFARHIAPDPLASSLWRLRWSWTCFGVAIILMLISLLVSQWAFRRQREIISLLYEDEPDPDEDESDPDDRNVPAILTDVLTKAALACFVAGVVLLASFALSNLN